MVIQVMLKRFTIKEYSVSSFLIFHKNREISLVAKRSTAYTQQKHSTIVEIFRIAS